MLFFSWSLLPFWGQRRWKSALGRMEKGFQITVANRNMLVNMTDTKTFACVSFHKRHWVSSWTFYLTWHVFLLVLQHSGQCENVSRWCGRTEWASAPIFVPWFRNQSSFCQSQWQSCVSKFLWRNANFNFKCWHGLCQGHHLFKLSVIVYNLELWNSVQAALKFPKFGCLAGKGKVKTWKSRCYPLKGWKKWTIKLVAWPSLVTFIHQSWLNSVWIAHVSTTLLGTVQKLSCHPRLQKSPKSLTECPKRGPL